MMEKILDDIRCTGEQGVKIIKLFESLHDGDLSLIGLQPKMCPAGVWTEGWGHAIRDDKGRFIKGAANKELAYKFSKIHDKKQADEILLIDLQAREHIVMQKVHVPLNQNQFDALVSYVYNTGGSSTLFKLINSKSSEQEIRSWMENKYVTVDGKYMPGLKKRRLAEANLYFQ